MIRKSNDLIKNLFVAFILAIALYTQVAFLTTDVGYYTVFISAAVASGFYVSFGKKILPAILATSIIGTLLFEIAVHGTTVTEAGLYVLPITFINIINPLIFGALLHLFQVKIPRTLSDGLKYAAAILLTVVPMAILPAIQFTYYNNSSFFYELHEFIQPMFVGMLIFTTSIILSNHYDDFLGLEVIKKGYDIIFAVLFSIFTYFIFTNYIEGFDFTSFGPVFIVLFMINAYVFNYRMLLFISWVYIVVYNLVLAGTLDTTVYFDTSVTLNIYLMILLAITVFTKILLSETREKNNQLEETKDRYEDMLNSTLELLNVKDTLSYSDETYHESYMGQIFDIAMRIFHKFEYGICVLRGNDILKLLDTQGHNKEFFNEMKVRNQGFDWSITNPLHIKDVQRFYQEALGERYSLFESHLSKIKESIALVLTLSDGEKGAIMFDILKGNDLTFTKGDFNNIAAFQSMINSFYENNELAIKNNNLRDDIVLSLIRTLELYDQYTGGHSEDVATIAELLAKKVGLPEEEIYDISWAGIVHDIGKIGIKSDIINKKGKLTLDEYKQVQQHPVYGYNILNKSQDLKQIAKLVRHHHEWYNGSGYPDGLTGKEIPYGAQILQVADSVSAMATTRSYTKQKTWDEIIKELEMYKGVQFNPEITEHMIELIKSGVAKKHFEI